MNLSFKLTLFREYHNCTFEQVAKELDISVEDYKNFEFGKTNISSSLAQKLSDFYKVPFEFFIIDTSSNHLQAEVIFNNCIFKGDGGNGYINHQYNDRGIDEILFTKKEEIKNLKEQIDQLNLINTRLATLLEHHLKKDL